MAIAHEVKKCSAQKVVYSTRCGYFGPILKNKGENSKKLKIGLKSRHTVLAVV